MSPLEKRITKLERPNSDKFDARLPATWQEFYGKVLNDGPARQSASALTAAEAWAICSKALSQADDESLEESWLDYLQCRKNWR
jgi:hypothetical protein